MILPITDGLVYPPENCALGHSPGEIRCRDTEDARRRMLFGREDAVLAFDNNRWETIRAPGTGFIRWLAVDDRGVVWFRSNTQIGYLSGSS